jgi:ribonuclease M5
LEIIKEVVVVEGYHDLAKLKAIYDEIDVIITNGSEISDDTLNELKMLNKKRGLILFLDPDYQGERIRKQINDFVGETKHAFLPKEKCINKNKTKVGIEHASKVDIFDALKNVLETKEQTINQITFQDLCELKLIGCNNARQNREILTNNLGIGLSNGKSILRKLNMFGFIKEDIINNIKR